jgi:hypothetical protein
MGGRGQQSKVHNRYSRGKPDLLAVPEQVAADT